MNIKIIDCKKGSHIAAKLAKENTLIPFIGSGFTANCKAKNGYCPTVEGLYDILYDLVFEYKDYLIEDFSKMKPNKCRRFFEIAPPVAIKKFFLDYFTQIELEDFKLDFLNKINWSHIYTFNIDNAIEDNGNFQPLLPYLKYKNYTIEKRPVYKLYGDAYIEVVDDECERVAFRNMYNRNLSAEKNKDFALRIQDDFTNKNILYIGTTIKQRDIRKIYEISTPKENLLSLYVTDTIPTPKEEGLLKVGVNRIILVEEFEDFYKSFVNNYKKI